MAFSKLNTPKLNTLVGIAEIISAIAVIISLVYLSNQINLNTTTLKSASAQSVQENFASWYSSIQGEPLLLEISIKGLEDYKNLNKIEKAQFISMFMTFSSYSQNAYYKWQEGSLSSELWRSWEYILLQFVLSPGGKDFWDERGYLFGDSFNNYVINDLMKRKSHPKAKPWGAVKLGSEVITDSIK